MKIKGIILLVLLGIQICNGQKMKTITLTRASVCAGDDINAPHYKKIEIGSNWKIEKILKQIIKSKYLPLVSGNATWSVAINEPIAVINQNNSDSIKLLTLPDYPNQETKGYINIKNIHFNYHAQQDAKIVYQVLRNFNLSE